MGSLKRSTFQDLEAYKVYSLIAFELIYQRRSAREIVLPSRDKYKGQSKMYFKLKFSGQWKHYLEISRKSAWI